MNIRLAKHGDIPALHRLLLEVGDVHHKIRPELFPKNMLKYTNEELSVLLADERRPVYVADQDGVVLGYCFCQWKDVAPPLVRRKELYIDDLCVEESCRGQGVASALYRHVCAVAKEAGCAFVTLNVWCGNDGAMEFYRHMGMTPRSITMETPLEDGLC